LLTFAFICTALPDPTCTVAVVAVEAVTPVPLMFIEMVIAGTVIVADADLVESAIEVAFTVTVRSLVGGALGAVYVALKIVLLPPAAGLVATLPHCAALQETVQVTPLPDASPVTVADTGSVFVAITEFNADETETEMRDWGVIAGVLPPQPMMTVVKEIATSVQAKETLRSICALRPWHKTDTVYTLKATALSSKFDSREADRAQTAQR